MFRIIVTQLLFITCAVTSESTISSVTSTSNDQVFLVPDKNFHMTPMSFDKRVKDTFDAGRDVKFYLYTRLNEEKPQNLTMDQEAIKKSNFNRTRETRFVVHGYLNNVESDINWITRTAILEAEDVNFIFVDWGKGAMTGNYIEARNRIGQVAQHMANFINFLDGNLTKVVNTTWIVGHSLGAHTAGLAAKILDRKIAAIFGLDPAGPLFWDDKPNQRLDANDAKHVVAIHTNTALLGYRNPIAKADIYPNGGAFQPGCGVDVYGVCSHGRSYDLFSEMISSKFSMRKCSDERQARSQRCLGEQVKFRREKIIDLQPGVYYIKTNDKYPYIP